MLLCLDLWEIKKNFIHRKIFALRIIRKIHIHQKIDKVPLNPFKLRNNYSHVATIHENSTKIIQNEHNDSVKKIY